MKTISIAGSSDDIVYVLCNQQDEQYVNPATIELSSEKTGESMIVYVSYAPTKKENYCWMIGVQPADEDVEIPDWKQQFKLDVNGYSPILSLEVPDDTKAQFL